MNIFYTISYLGQDEIDLSECNDRFDKAIDLYPVGSCANALLLYWKGIAAYYYICCNNAQYKA